MHRQPSPESDPTEPVSGSIKSLLSDLRSEVTQLFQKEAELVRAELGEKVSALGRHAARISAGGAIAYAGLIIVLFSLGDLVRALLINGGMEANTATWVGRLSVGLIVALVGWIMLSRARKAAKNDDLVPEKTLQSLRDNKQWMQRKLKESHEPI